MNQQNENFFQLHFYFIFRRRRYQRAHHLASSSHLRRECCRRKWKTKRTKKIFLFSPGGRAASSAIRNKLIISIFSPTFFLWSSCEHVDDVDAHTCRKWEKRRRIINIDEHNSIYCYETTMLRHRNPARINFNFYPTREQHWLHAKKSFPFSNFSCCSHFSG